jgi:hypothetical protein
MNDQAVSFQTLEIPQDKKQITHLLIFFALVYVVEGLGQIGGLVSQPLNYYLKEV